jgi:DinB superfamily
MKNTKWVFASLLLLACNNVALAQTKKLSSAVLVAQTDIPAAQERVDKGAAALALEAQREKHALQVFLKSVQTQIVPAADAMPAVKYGFVPTDGEFKGARTFGQQVKHLAATNHILAAAALGEEPPSDAGDEQGPENIRTKPELLDYLNASFTHLGKAIDGIGDNSAAVKSSPISPLPASKTTRLALTVEALIHAFDHYGQMVEYLPMNGVVPPASQP